MVDQSSMLQVIHSPQQQRSYQDGLSQCISSIDMNGVFEPIRSKTRVKGLNAKLITEI